MLYNSLYNSKLWKKLDSKSRNIRILILGTVFYVIAHSFIYSNYVEGVEIIANYRRFLYYLIALDLGLFGLRVYMGKNKNDKKKKNKKKGQFLMGPNYLPPQIAQMMTLQNQMKNNSANPFKQNPYPVQRDVPQRYQQPFNPSQTTVSHNDDSNASMQIPVYDTSMANQDAGVQSEGGESIPIYHPKQEQFTNSF